LPSIQKDEKRSTPKEEPRKSSMNLYEERACASVFRFEKPQTREGAEIRVIKLNKTDVIVTEKDE
jgi:hypothetical protein